VNRKRPSELYATQCGTSVAHVNRLTDCNEYRIRQFCASSRLFFFRLCVDHFLFAFHEFTSVSTSRSYGNPPPPTHTHTQNTIKPDLARFQVITEGLLKTGGFFWGGGGGSGWYCAVSAPKVTKVPNALWYGITSQKTWIFMLNFDSTQVPL